MTRLSSSQAMELFRWREAVEAINTGSDVDGISPTSGEYGTDDRIEFDSSLFAEPQSLLLAAGELPLTQPVSIVGPGRELLTIDAQLLSRVFNIEAGDSHPRARPVLNKRCYLGTRAGNG